MNSKRVNKGARILFVFILFFLVGFLGGTHKANAASKYPYQIKINKKCNVVTVYKKDSKGNYTKAVKAFACSTGSATPLGTFHTQVKYRWKVLSHGVWGQYCTRITGNFLFHSVWYYKKDPSKLTIKQYNRLGTTASAGCVRLTTADAKWIYDNCGLGTTVTIYNSKNPGPLGKPKTMKISKYTWDPTDVWSKKNPWNKKNPYIKGASNKTVYVGQNIDFKAGVKAYDTCGNKITNDLKIDTSKLNLKKAGTYKVTYKVTDLLGRTAKVKIKVKVIEPQKAEIVGAENKVLRYESYKNKKLDSYVMNGVYGKVGGQKLTSKDFWYSYKVVQNDNKALVYKVTYTARNPYNKVKTKKKVTFILDKQAPTINCDKLYLTEEQFADFTKELEKKQYKHASFKDNVTAANKLSVATSVTKCDASTYRVCYTVKDQVGNTAKADQMVYVLTSPKLEVKNQTVTVTEKGAISKEALSNVTFTAGGKDYTSMYKDQIKVEIKEVEADVTYEVTYTLKVGSHTLSTKATYQVHTQQEESNETATKAE